MPTIPGTYDELQRGRKPCPNCEAIIGAGRRKCPACGHAFGAAVKEKHEEIAQVQHNAHLIVPGTRLSNSTDVLIIPAGRCPKKLTSSDPAVVKKWMTDVAAEFAPTGRRERVMLSVDALCWWAREFFPQHTKGYNQVRAILQATVDPQLQEHRHALA